MSNLNADADIDSMEAGLKEAAGELELIASENMQLQADFELQRWKGLDALSGVKADIDGVRDDLINVAEMIGVGGRIVRDARANNSMISEASKESLGHA